jgi:diguanylate cyclase (GGDEF)-like protein/PAS domain S-box-containing protein
MLSVLSNVNGAQWSGWSEAIGLVAGLAAVVAILGGVWTTSDRADRGVRTMLAVAAVLYTVSQVTHLAATIGSIPIPLAMDVLPLLGLLVILGACWYRVLAPRFSRPDGIAVVLDSAVVFCTMGAASLVIMSGRVVSPDGAVALTYTVTFAATLGAGVILTLAITPRRTVGGWLAMIGGAALFGVGAIWHVYSTSPAWVPDGLVQAGGALMCAFGCATWTSELDPSERFRAIAARIRDWLPIAAVAVAPVLLVSNELLLLEHGDELVGLAADSLLALVLMLCVIRQTMLLRERDRSTAEAHHEADRASSLMDDLRQSEQRFRSLVTNSSDVFLIIAADGTISYQSPAVERVLGYGPGERLGRQIFEITHPDDTDFVQATIRDLITSPGGQHTIELRAHHADGSWRTLEATGRNMLDDPSVHGIVVNYRDVTERKRLEHQLTHQAFHDPLTGLANRALFIDRVNHASQRRDDGRRVAVLFMDLDDFKTINDSLGHVAGDLVLRAVSERLRAALRPEDTVARLGGDEFAVLLEHADPEVARAVADRLLEALDAPFEIGGRQVRIGASIGAAFAADGGNADALLRNADVAMYTAKGRGKGRIELFEAAMHAAAVTRLELRADLEHALDRHQLRLRYQPVFDLPSGRLDSFEALLRWRHPSRGELQPGDFVPLAEETGLIVPIGRWVLDEACRQAQAWRETGHPDLSVSLNVAPRQLQEAELIRWVGDALARSGLPPEHLMLELTETGIMLDEGGLLAQLRALGVRLALDDFGTGYSSLSYLARFPIDVLKIDRSFVARLGREDEDTALVRSVVQLAATMNLRTVAEGIERPEQLERVKELGCDFGQGYFFAEPMHAIGATALVSGSTADAALQADEGADAGAGDEPVASAS